MPVRDFKGVWIPKEVWLDERLNALEKIILVEIDSLDAGDEHCWKSNDELAKFCQCSASKVSKAISRLIELGYIRVFSFDGRNRKLQSCLAFFTRQDSKKSEADKQKMPVSNTKSNTKSIYPPITPPRGDDEIPKGFDSFYAIYPKKVAKKTAFNAWKKLKPSESLTGQIIEDVRRRLDGVWKGMEITYIPNPSTYLNQRRWEDETTSSNVVEPEREKNWWELPLEEQRAMEDRLADEYWASKGK